ncbi:MAG: hypothetical protein Q9183_004745 [Haloplaca sp. 2 TL-2023]
MQQIPISGQIQSDLATLKPKVVTKSQVIKSCGAKSAHDRGETAPAEAGRLTVGLATLTSYERTHAVLPLVEPTDGEPGVSVKLQLIMKGYKYRVEDYTTKPRKPTDPAAQSNGKSYDPDSHELFCLDKFRYFMEKDLGSIYYQFLAETMQILRLWQILAHLSDGKVWDSQKLPMVTVTKDNIASACERLDVNDEEGRRNPEFKRLWENVGGQVYDHIQREDLDHYFKQFFDDLSKNSEIKAQLDCLKEHHKALETLQTYREKYKARLSPGLADIVDAARRKDGLNEHVRRLQRQLDEKHGPS